MWKMLFTSGSFEAAASVDRLLGRYFYLKSVLEGHKQYPDCIPPGLRAGTISSSINQSRFLRPRWSSLLRRIFPPNVHKGQMSENVVDIAATAGHFNEHLFLVDAATAAAALGRNDGSKALCSKPSRK